MSKIIYVCSKYSGDVAKNKENARKYTRFVIDHGFIPITPHLYITECLDDNNPTEREKGLSICKKLLMICDEMWVFTNGEPLSSGMIDEFNAAQNRFIPLPIRIIDSL